MRHPLPLRCVLLALLAVPCRSQDRETRVRNDLAQITQAGQWIYDDLAKGFAEAKASGKPLLVVLRCIPCEACRGFDEQVATLDARIGALLEKFVRVRIPKANGLDLELFQLDWDLSFAALFLNADRTIYGRFGSPSTQHDKTGAVSIPAFREALTTVLDLHARFAQVKDALRAKSPGANPLSAPRFPVPEKYPALAGRYQAGLDYEGKVVPSCIHCHQVRDAERLIWRGGKEPIPDRVLFPWPLPDVLGIELDPARRAHVARVVAGSAAAKAGIEAGDDLVALVGQPLVSIADVQWVLENAPDQGQLAAVVRRGDADKPVTLPLAAGWRRRGDVSWRTTTWDLRRLALGGLRLTEASDDERARLAVAADRMALRAVHVGEFGEHATAKQAGFRKGDVVVGVAGDSTRASESELLARLLQTRKPGERVEFTVRRGEQTLTLAFAMR